MFETFASDSDEGREIQKNAGVMIGKLVERGVEMDIPVEQIVGACFMVWKSADELLEFDTEDERMEFEEAMRGTCLTCLQASSLETITDGVPPEELL